MAIQRSSTSRSLVKVLVAVALGMLLSKSGSLPPVAVGPSTVRVYHYTNEAGYFGIRDSGHIKPSDIKQGDAFYGSGVYGTQLDPSTPVYTILHNNYDRDGGINGRGKDKMDRADYVIALDLDESSVEIVDTNGSRSVLCFGGGEAVPLGEATFHGPADDVALEVEREQRFQEFLSQDSILAKAWQLYDNDVKLVFVYMDSVNYQIKLNQKESGNRSQDVPALVNQRFPWNFTAMRGFDKVLVMLTSDGDVPGCSGDWEQCIFHGDIDRVESDLVCKLKQWTKHWVHLQTYPLSHRVVPQSLDFLTKLRREVVARDCTSSWDKCILLYFANESESIIERYSCRVDYVNGWIEGRPNITIFSRLAQNKEKVYMFIASNRTRLDRHNCLLYGRSWLEQNSRVTDCRIRFRYWSVRDRNYWFGDLDDLDDWRRKARESRMTFPSRLKLNSVRNSWSRDRFWQQKMRNPCFWVAFTFERMFFLDLGEKAFVETLPKSPKNILFQRKMASITSPAHMRALHQRPQHTWNEHIIHLDRILMEMLW